MKRIITACSVIAFSLLVSWILFAGPSEVTNSSQTAESKENIEEQNLEKVAIAKDQDPLLGNKNSLAVSSNPNSFKTVGDNFTNQNAQKKEPKEPTIKNNSTPSFITTSSSGNSNELEVMHYAREVRKKYMSLQNTKLIPRYIDELNRNIAKVKNPELRHQMLQDRQRLLERFKQDNRLALNEKRRRQANLINRYKRSARSRYNTISNVERIPQLLAELDKKISSENNNRLVQLMVEDKKRLLRRYRSTFAKQNEQ